jgi:hypothetical protein
MIGADIFITTNEAESQPSVSTYSKYPNIANVSAKKIVP